jgi:hypothetical protein
MLKSFENNFREYKLIYNDYINNQTLTKQVAEINPNTLVNI